MYFHREYRPEIIPKNMVLRFVSVFLVFLSIGLSWCATTPTPQDDGGFRNLWQFGNMIKFTTNRSPFDFINYGCYCGWGGSGNPVDDLDRCCKVHDECYGKLQTFTCRPKLVTYSWKKVLNKVVCYKGFFDGDCDLNVCKCDRDAAHCFASAAYNDEYNKMDQSVCRE